MADPITTAELERRMADAVKRVFGARRRQVEAVLKRPGGDWQRALDRVYTQLRDELADEFGPLIRDGALDAALATQAQAGVSVSVDALGSRATRYAQRYTFDLVGGIVDTTRQRLGDALVSFLDDESIDLRTLGETVGKIFGQARGQTIATTEATRAAAQGQKALVDELRAENPDARVEEIWQTSEDEIVCPVCGPKNGKRITGGDRPPAHPNCRCAVRVVVLSVGGRRV